VTSPFQLIVGRALIGLGAPLFFAVAMTLILSLFDEERHGGAMGVFQGIEFAGAIMGATFSGYLVSIFNFRTSFLLSAFLVAIAFLVLMATPQIRKYSKKQTSNNSTSFPAITKVFSNRNLIIVSSATFAEFVMSSGVIMTVFPLYANEELNITLTSIGLLMGARSLGFVIAMFTMGAFSDKIGRRPVLQFGLGATALLVLIITYFTSFNSLAIIIFMIGATTGAIWIISPVIAAESVSPDLRGAAIGTYRTFFDLGSILGPIMMSMIMEAYGIKLCFTLASILLLVNLLPTLWLKVTREY